VKSYITQLFAIEWASWESTKLGVMFAGGGIVIMAMLYACSKPIHPKTKRNPWIRWPISVVTASAGVLLSMYAWYQM